MILRSTLRSLSKEPGFVATSIVTLALGIGSSTAIFSVIESVLLRPLPYGDAERLVVVWETEPDRDELNVAGANLIDWQDQNASFDGLAAFTPVLLTRGDGDLPERLAGVEVTPNFFDVLDVLPHLGRRFTDDPTDAETVILSYEYWERASGALGDTLTLNDRNYTVIGVTPPGFKIPFENADLWTRSPNRVPTPPIDVGAAPDELRGLHWLRTIARLKRDVTIESAQADLDVIAARLATTYSEDNAQRGVQIVPLHEQITGDVRPALLVLFGAVGFLLLIACANVANLLLARASGREREIAVRAALGATRRRIVTELLTESLLLAMTAGALGLMLSHALTRWILVFGPGDVFRLDAVDLNPAVFFFSLTVSFATGLVFGVLPAIQTSNPDLQSSLKDGARSSSGSSRRLRETLVVAEVSLALILLVSAGLLMRSFYLLRSVDPGFSPQNILTMRLWLPDSRYDEPAKIAAAYRDVLERLETIRGVESSSAVLGVPLSGMSANFGITVEGRPEPLPGEELSAGFQSVAPGYFRTMGIPLLRGRDLALSDGDDAPMVAVVSTTAAERFWPLEDPIGKRFTQDGEDWIEVVGIVSDVLHNGLDQDPRAEVYASFQQVPFPFMTLVLKSRGEPEALSALAQQEIRAVDPALPVYKVMPLSEVVSESVAEPRFNTFLLGIFAATAILLAAIGLYGLMAYNVSQRQREIGIRVALGAETRDVLGLVLREGLFLTLCGLAIGLIAAFAASRFLEALLFQVAPTDAATYGAVALLLLAVAFVASIVPARRAARIDPLVSLRYE